MTTRKKLTVLDCTLRDGGYYNNWDFKPKLVRAYLAALGAAKVDVVEIGFRSNPTEQFCGPYAYSTDRFLSQLEVPEGLSLCVMADAKDLLSAEKKAAGAVLRSFSPSAASPVRMVRIATHFGELAQCQALVASLKELGYVVGLNLMQATQQSDEVLRNAASQVEKWRSVDVLYFADSLGDMVPADVRKMMGLLQSQWSGEIGIHTHDNRGIALLNALEAVDQGATWIDATILGMGRGAGNAKTEHLLIDLVSRGHEKYDPAALFQLVLEDFSKLQNEYKWGTSLLYYLAAEYSIHPTYVQKMMSLNHVAPSAVIEGIQRLKALPSLSFNASQLERVIGSADVDVDGTINAKDVIAGRDVLLLAGGDSVMEHQTGLVDFIESRKNLFVINLNAEPLLPDKHITAYASCHPVRAITELDSLAQITKPLVIPVDSLPVEWAERLRKGDSVLNYGLRTGAKSFVFGERMASLPRTYVAMYAASFANAGGARRIYLAGFDGYPLGDTRQAEMVELLELYAETPGAVELIALTPTAYPVTQSSLYDPKA